MEAAPVAGLLARRTELPWALSVVSILERLDSCLAELEEATAEGESREGSLLRSEEDDTQTDADPGVPENWRAGVADGRENGESPNTVIDIAADGGELVALRELKLGELKESRDSRVPVGPAVSVQQLRYLKPLLGATLLRREVELRHRELSESELPAEMDSDASDAVPRLAEHETTMEKPPVEGKFPETACGCSVKGASMLRHWVREAIALVATVTKTPTRFEVLAAALRETDETDTQTEPAAAVAHSLPTLIERRKDAVCPKIVTLLAPVHGPLTLF